MTKTIAALYDDITHAHDAIRELTRNPHFVSDDISLVGQDADSRYSRYIKEFEIDEKIVTPIEASAGAGATAGTVVGGLVGLLAGMSLIVLPGAGPVLALGPIGATLAGAGVGAAVGGLAGALVGVGIESSHAELYTEAVRRGSSLLLVRAREEHVDEAIEILKRHSPVDIEKRAEHWRDLGWTNFDAEAEPYNYEQITSEYQSYPEEIRFGRPGYGVNTYAGAISPPAFANSDELSAQFDQHFEHHPPHQASTLSRADYTAAYELGAQLAYDEKINKMRWEQAQAEAHKRWAEQHDRRDESWEEIKDRVQYAWHKVKAEYYEATA